MWSNENRKTSTGESRGTLHYSSSMNNRYLRWRNWNRINSIMTSNVLSKVEKRKQIADDAFLLRSIAMCEWPLQNGCGPYFCGNWSPKSVNCILSACRVTPYLDIAATTVYVPSLNAPSHANFTNCSLIRYTLLLLLLLLLWLLCSGQRVIWIVMWGLSTDTVAGQRLSPENWKPIEVYLHFCGIIAFLVLMKSVAGCGVELSWLDVDWIRGAAECTVQECAFIRPGSVFYACEAFWAHVRAFGAVGRGHCS